MTAPAKPASGVRQWLQRYHFLFTPRWVFAFLLTGLFAVATGFLGQWQHDRHEQRQAAIAQIEHSYDRAPVTDQLRFFTDFQPQDRWQRVQLRGHYLVAGTRIIRNRVNAGRPGYEVTVPFRTLSGTTIIISRGWLPLGNEQAGRPDHIPQPQQSAAQGPATTVVVRAQAGEPELDRDAPAGQLASINLAEYQKQLGYPIATSGYGQLVSEDPAAAEMPESPLPPSTDAGPHLSYSWQWFLFGLLGFVGYGYAARRTAWAAEYAAEEEATQSYRHAAWRPAPAKRKTSRRKISDEDAEDALLDGATPPPAG